jgi:preprotein translocase subunit SecA
MMQKLGMTEDLPLESRMVQRAMEQAQQKVEGHNFDIRKRLVEFDDVINEHRKIIYAEREKILSGVDTRDNVLSMVLDELETICGDENAEAEVLVNEIPEDTPSAEEVVDLGDELSDEVLARAEDKYESIEKLIGEENMRKVEHWLLLESIDFHWREHLTAIDDLRQSIGLQAYAQVDPLVAFKREGYDMFQQLQGNIRKQVARTAFKVRIEQKPAQAAAPATPAAPANGANAGSAAAPAPGAPAASAAPTAAPVLTRSAAPAAAALRTNRSDGGATAPAAATKRAPAAIAPKVGRNDPCHCGSGKKFKKCHGAL